MYICRRSPTHANCTLYNDYCTMHIQISERLDNAIIKYIHVHVHCVIVHSTSSKALQNKEKNHTFDLKWYSYVLIIYKLYTFTCFSQC